jgi:hypothetical protein
MAEWCRKYHVEIWAWCLMPNHVHLIALPESGVEFRGQGVPGTVYLIAEVPGSTSGVYRMALV